MKRLLCQILFASLICLLPADVLLNDYSFQYATGVYEEITEGIALGSAGADRQYICNPQLPTGSNSVSSGPGFPLGFDFTFAGESFDRIGVHVDGWIALGKSTYADQAVDMRSSLIYMPLSTTLGGQQDETLVARIAAFGNNICAQEGSSILLRCSGSAPQRKVTIQWKHYGRNDISGDSFNFQIQLREADMSIAINYGQIQVTTAFAVQVGMRASPASNGVNFANRYLALGGSWDTTVAGTQTQDTAAATPSQYPAQGSSFIWNPPTVLQADFSANPLSGTAPLSVQFTDLSSAGASPLTSWNWSFGDQSSSLQNPLITFPHSGVYDISLSVGDGTASASITKVAYITVYPADIPGVNTSIIMDGNDAIVSWEPITRDVDGSNRTSQYYFLYFNGSTDPLGDFYFLAPIAYPNTQYRHVGVGLGAQHMYYRVTVVSADQEE
ncbi:MAG: PKD domain-containing protein [Candidatus Cloacimonetes bacterium]|jgi:PKD repeat protein|nr:PKD domain-containing protein [Candidatus Cloacimonadota bacterium]MDD2506402.1 PKD domain-containing protein [Candidatus Cloacimonadota bacterium]MDD4147181.1 PKD domain-containing protein [Candidatus Cloacimonadota bacterium]MDD4559807.1 PKD domain-containing protein [Candidatus Cloacimonadota bacterium]